MSDFNDIHLLERIVGSALTLYMLALTVRWVAPFIELDLNSKRVSWLPRITDPLVKFVRQAMPKMGAVDVAPGAAVIGVWLVRLVVLGY